MRALREGGSYTPFDDAEDGDAEPEPAREAG
jgi:hypothetical protein